MIIWFSRVIKGAEACPSDASNSAFPRRSRLEMSWYVVQTRSNHEALVETGLRRRGLETFLPRITVPGRRRDRSRLVHAPRFRGICSCTPTSRPPYTMTS